MGKRKTADARGCVGNTAGVAPVLAQDLGAHLHMDLRHILGSVINTYY